MHPTLFLPLLLCTWSSVCASCCWVAMLLCLHTFQAFCSNFVQAQVKPGSTARYSRDEYLWLVHSCVHITWPLCWSTHPRHTLWPCAHMLADNTDQIKLALTIATRKRSITQPVHFSAEGSKSMAVSALRDLCLREQEISPHTDSRDMEQLYDEHNWKNWSSNCGKCPC